jgi:antirestriction protein ArdC
MREKRDIYQEVTDRIIASLEKGTVPWHQPWKNLGADSRPRNVRSGKPYRGINVFLLGLAALEGGYSDPRWGTYKAITEKGGQIRKGEKGTHVILWKRIPKRDAEPDENGRVPQVMFLRDYTVFNVEQADGIEPLPTVELPEHERIGQAQALVEDYLDGRGPAYSFGGDQAYYAPSLDSVRIPLLGQFENAPFYYKTLFHELAHSTGHPSRLKRYVAGGFAIEPYAKEELVAEMTAAMLCGLSGIEDETHENSASYIANWLSALKDDKKLVVQAAAQAQKAADLVVGATFEDEETSAAGDAAALAVPEAVAA